MQHISTVRTLPRESQLKASVSAGSISTFSGRLKLRNPKIRMNALTTAESNIHLEPRLVSRPKTQTKSERVSHIGKTQIRRPVRDLASVIENQAPEGPPNSLVILHLNQHQIWCPKTVISESSECGLAINVGTAKRLLHIERHNIRVTGV